MNLNLTFSNLTPPIEKAEDNDVLATLAKSISGMGTYVDGRRSLIKQIKNQTRRLTRIKKPEIRHCDILVLNDCIMIICDSQGRGSRFGKEKGMVHDSVMFSFSSLGASS